MKTIEDLQAKYTQNEKVPTLNDLFDLLSVHGTQQEKEIIAEGYISDFTTCQYDYVCGKLNNLDWIWDMMDWVEKIQKLIPDFDQYHFYKAHVYEMLSNTYKEQNLKIKYNNLSTINFRKQQQIDGNDVMLLINLAQSLIEYSSLTLNFEKQNFDEIKSLLCEAIHLERKEEHQSNFFGFNGVAINSFLNTSYDLLMEPFDNRFEIHKEFIATFKQTIEPYTKKDPSIYYHWAETLFRIMERINSPHQKDNYNIPSTIKNNIWKEIQITLHQATDLESSSDFFLVNVGHLFDKAAKKELNFSYFEIAYTYYSKALDITNENWSTPTYASNTLRTMALICLNNEEPEKSTQLFNQGLQILEAAQKKVNDFQLSVNHGNYLYDYAKYLENFSNTDTLLKAKIHFEESIALANNFYTSPYYGLAKTTLRLGDKKLCLKILKDSGKIFSNEYHIHDFNEIIDDPEFKEIQADIPKLIIALQKLKY